MPQPSALRSVLEDASAGGKAPGPPEESVATFSRHRLTLLSKFDPVFVQLKIGREGLKDVGLGMGMGRRSSVSRTGVTNPFPQQRRALDSLFPFYLECGRWV